MIDALMIGALMKSALPSMKLNLKCKFERAERFGDLNGKARRALRG